MSRSFVPSFKFPAPKQENCIITSNSIYNYCQELWNQRNEEGINEIMALLTDIRGIRKAIMNRGSDDEIPPIRWQKLRDIYTNYSEATLPRPLCVTIRLPILPKAGAKFAVFDTSLWYFVYYAMQPTVSNYTLSESVLKVCDEIYNNKLIGLTSVKHEKYERDAKTEYANKMKFYERDNGRDYETKKVAVQSYKDSFMSYQDMKRRTIDECYNNVMSAVSLIRNTSEIFNKSNPKVYMFWTILTSNPAFATDFHPEFTPFNLIFDGEDRFNDFSKISQKMREVFKSENQDIEAETCTETQWLKTITLRAFEKQFNMFTLYYRPEILRGGNLMFQKKMIEHESKVIYDWVNLLKSADYEPFAKNPAKYRKVEFQFTITKSTIRNIILNLNLTNYQSAVDTLKDANKNDIAEFTFGLCGILPSLAILEIKLCKDLNIPKEIMMKYLAEVSNLTQFLRETFIAGMFIYEYFTTFEEIRGLKYKRALDEHEKIIILPFDAKKEEIEAKNWAYSEIELDYTQILINIFNFKNLYDGDKTKFDFDLKEEAERYKGTDGIKNKDKWALMDIIDDFDRTYQPLPSPSATPSPSPIESPTKTPVKTPTKTPVKFTQNYNRKRENYVRSGVAQSQFVHKQVYVPSAKAKTRSKQDSKYSGNSNGKNKQTSDKKFVLAVSNEYDLLMDD